MIVYVYFDVFDDQVENSVFWNLCFTYFADNCPVIQPSVLGHSNCVLVFVRVNKKSSRQLIYEYGDKN